MKALKLQDLYTRIKDEDREIEYVNYWADPGKNLISDYIKDHDIKTSCAKECVVCQICHIEKYKVNYVDTKANSLKKIGENPNLMPTHPFQIKCRTIPEDYRDAAEKRIGRTLNEEEKEILVSLADPVSFAKKYFGWTARKHQEVSLRCSSKKKVLRWGRRSGKSDSFAIEILWNIFTRSVNYQLPNGETGKRGIKVLVIAPYDSQVSEIFDKIRNFLDLSPELKEGSTYIKSPFHKYVFPNKAEIRGFTTGSHDAESVRGQDADIIFIDEADYMSEGDYRTILPVANSKPNVPLRVASTPKGKRENYWKWCLNDPQWKEFYFPTPVIDITPVAQTQITWAEMRRGMRSEYTRDGWLQEVMAIFIAMAAGVYQPEFISRAHKPYTYEEMRQKKLNNSLELLGWKYSIGVDWNSNAGTWIYVTGYNPKYGFKVFDVSNVPKQDFTQLMGLEKIIELIEFWKPKYVYVDAGHGATNWEMLQLWAQEHPETHGCSIKENIKKYEFGGVVEIREATTQKIVKQPAKAYMVENSVRKFEDNNIVFSSKDKTLTDQLLNYIIKSRSESGKPLYDQENKQIGDHALDAFNLSLVAWAIEEGIFAPNSFDPITRVGVLGSALHKLKEKIKREEEAKEFNEADAMSLAERVGFKNLAPPSSRKDKENHRIIARPEIMSVSARDALYKEVSNRKADLEKRSIDSKSAENKKIKQVRHGWFDDTEHLHEYNSSVKQIKRKKHEFFKNIKSRSI